MGRVIRVWKCALRCIGVSGFKKSDKHCLESYINARTCQSSDATIVGPTNYMSTSGRTSRLCSVGVGVDSFIRMMVLHAIAVRSNITTNVTAVHL